MINRELILANSVLYSERFGFDLKRDAFPWFLLSVLFGARISESIAIRTFIMFRSEGIMDPESIIEAGFDGLVSILDAGGYTRYDFRTAVKLEEMSRNILKANGLNEMHDAAEDFADIVKRLKALAKGIGDVTVGIFMREMVGVWPKAEPYPSTLAREGAKYIGVDIKSGHSQFNVDYGRFESFLVKVAKECVRKKASRNAGLCEVLKE